MAFLARVMGPGGVYRPFHNQARNVFRFLHVQLVDGDLPWLDGMERARSL